MHGSQGSVQDMNFPSFTTVNQVYVCFGFVLTDPSVSSADENSESESDSDDRFKGKGSACNNSSQPLSQTLSMYILLLLHIVPVHGLYFLS